MIALDRAVTPTRSRTIPWWQAAWFAGIAASLAFVAGVWVAAVSVNQDEREHLIALHVASLGQDDKLVSVRSTDRHIVKPWFAGKIDFTPPVADDADQGFALLGGRLDSVGGKAMAAVVFRIRRHDINLFVSRAADLRSVPLRSSTLRGFSIVAWSADGLAFSAVSDVDLCELERFAALVR